MVDPYASRTCRPDILESSPRIARPSSGGTHTFSRCSATRFAGGDAILETEVMLGAFSAPLCAHGAVIADSWDAPGPQGRGGEWFGAQAEAEIPLGMINPAYGRNFPL